MKPARFIQLLSLPYRHRLPAQRDKNLFTHDDLYEIRHRLVALADDGSVWTRREEDGQWLELPVEMMKGSDLAPTAEYVQVTSCTSCGPHGHGRDGIRLGASNEVCDLCLQMANLAFKERGKTRRRE